MYTIAMGMPGGSELLILLMLILPTIFWIWTLVDCAVREPSEGNEKLTWLIVIVLVGIIGSLLYCLVRRPARIKQYGK